MVSNNLLLKASLYDLPKICSDLLSLVLTLIQIMICNYFCEEENLIVDKTSSNVIVLEHQNAIEPLNAVSDIVAGKEAK